MRSLPILLVWSLAFASAYAADRPSICFLLADDRGETRDLAGSPATDALGRALPTPRPPTTGSPWRAEKYFSI